MGYAQLVFPSNPQAGQVLKAIVKVLGGETNLTNIEGLRSTPAVGEYTYSSQIYNPSGHAWTLQYPTSLPENGNFNIQTATLKSECLTAGKFKFIRLAIASSAGAFTEPANAGSTNHTLTTNYRIYAQGLSAIDGSGNATNLTYRNNDGSSAFVAKGTSTTEVFVIRMSWSNRHVFCSPYLSVSAASTFFGCFEFNENHLTQYSNSAPCIHITGFGATGTLGNYTINDAGDHNVVSLLAMHNPITATTPGVRAITTTTSTMHMSNISAFGLASNVSFEFNTRKFQVNNRYEIAAGALIVDDTASQLGIINCSNLSKIFLYFNYTMELATVTSTIDSSLYKTWNLFNSNNSSYSTIIVPYS